MIIHCCDERRRNAVAAHPTLNGIDYLEVVDNALPDSDPLRQRTLLVRFLKPIAVGEFTGEQVTILGGERVRDLQVTWIARATPLPPELSAPQEAEVGGVVAGLPQPEQVLVVRTAQSGDFSPYRLRLRRSALDDAPPAGLDPRLAEIDFSFKVECPSELDCRPRASCPPELASTPDIDYLAKDYPSLRRLVLDRLTTLVPHWRERSAADLGVTLAELIAYVGDQLSYQQDAVATEAYLETARLRTSLRRHALLVDYHLHDGCNARVWLHLSAAADAVFLAQAATRFYTRLPGRPSRIVPGSREDLEALRSAPVVFEPMHDATLHQTHNRIPLYSWGDSRCCLPRGATAATLSGHLPALARGDLLLFEEVLGPLTGEAGDADPAHRHLVRLASVQSRSPDDPGAPRRDPLTGSEITEVTWAHEDALPFPLCLSSLTDAEHGELLLPEVSVARGNIVLADHGYTLSDDEDLGTVPQGRLSYPPDRDATRCSVVGPIRLPPRYLPELANGPLTFAGTVRMKRPTGSSEAGEQRAFDPQAPAAAAMQWRMEDTRPALELTSTPDGGIADMDPWKAQRDLLNSGSTAPHFVAEVEHDGSSRLRFGDGVHGRRPEPGTAFSARYRIGNGRLGNVGEGSIAHVVCGDADVLAVRNPLPAQGGSEPEDAATVRRRAPQAFRRQERAVTPADYAEVAERYPGLQRATATLRWTGSWHTVFATVDRVGGLPVDTHFERDLSRHLERYRMAGHDIEIDDPIFVSLEIELLVCVASGYLRSDVRSGLLAVLGNRQFPDGRVGLFHPDRLSFGQTVFLSPLYAAARRVAGVASVQATTFGRQGSDDPTALDAGFMTLSRLEIPRLDNDPNVPEHGVLRLNLFGGQ